MMAPVYELSALVNKFDPPAAKFALADLFVQQTVAYDLDNFTIL